MIKFYVLEKIDELKLSYNSSSGKMGESLYINLTKTYFNVYKCLQ